MNGTLARMFRSLRRLSAPVAPRESRSPARRMAAESSILDLQLQSLLERCVPGSEIFIFLPATPWSMTTDTRSQRFARELAQAGHLVIYDCTGTLADGIGLKEIEPNLMIYRGLTRNLAALPDPILWTVLDNVSQLRRYPAECRVVYDWVENPDVLRRVHEHAMEDATVVVSVLPVMAARSNLICVPYGEESLSVEVLLDRLSERRSAFRAA